MADDLDNFLSAVSTPKQTKCPINSPSCFKYHPDGWILPNSKQVKELKYIASLSEDTCASFDEWKICGYWVLKGSKSYFQDIMGVPQFTIEQVQKSKW